MVSKAPELRHMAAMDEYGYSCMCRYAQQQPSHPHIHGMHCTVSKPALGPRERRNTRESYTEDARQRLLLITATAPHQHIHAFFDDVALRALLPDQEALLQPSQRVVRSSGGQTCVPGCHTGGGSNTRIPQHARMPHRLHALGCHGKVPTAQHAHVNRS
jgi:hypothetical protein